MPTSGSEDFRLNRYQWLARSLRMVGAVDKGQPPDKKLMDEAAIAANCILKELDLSFSNLHLTVTNSFNLTSGTNLYTSANGLFTNINEIQTGIYVDSNTNDVPLHIIERKEWESLRDKDSIGIPQKIFLTEEADTALRSLYVWPRPQDARPLRLTYWRRVFDVDAQTDELDFPPESYSYLCFRLGADLCEEYAVADGKAQRIYDKSRLLFQDLKARMTPKTTNYPVKERKFY